LLVGERLAMVMGGSSGVLMSIFFTAAGQKLHDGQSRCPRHCSAGWRR
jgi:dihydroxyacetone kinase